MTWTKLGDDFCDRPGLFGVSRSARYLLVELYVFANRVGLDGRIPRRQLHRLTDAENPDLELKELVEVGAVEIDGGAIVIDWSDQETKERIDQRRRATRERKERWKRHRSGDHALCLPESCAKAGTRSGTQVGTDGGALPRPARPVPKGNGSGTADGSARATPPLRGVDPHSYLDDGSSGLFCEYCGLPSHNRIHDRQGNYAAVH
jgi:hypothetical protein